MGRSMPVFGDRWFLRHSHDIEQLVLSGALFNDQERSSSPERSRSPDSDVGARDWPPLSGSEDSDADYDSDAARRAALNKMVGDGSKGAADTPPEPVGMRPGRTGVKGVIRDRAEADARARSQKAMNIAQKAERMAPAARGAMTVLEEEALREKERASAEGRLGITGTFKGKFGHLREVGVKGFVEAVEKEERGVWVVVHLYDPSLDRCFELDGTLSRLARAHPNVKFIRTRAGALGFASLSSRKTKSRGKGTAKRPSRIAERDDEDDPYDYDYEDEDEADSVDDDDDVDLDVLPTLLVYLGGELVHNWVRVDWEAGREGIEELLRKHRILQVSRNGDGNCGLPSDDEDDLFDSDENA